MGKLTMESNAAAATSVNSYLPGSSVQTQVRNVMMLQLGIRHGQLNKSQALKGQTVDTEWWMCPAIPVKDIVPTPQASVQTAVVPENKKKSKKKVVGREMDIAVGQCRKAEGIPDFANGDPGTLVLPETGLGLRLNSEEVLKAWYGRGSVFADGNDPDLPRSSADVLIMYCYAVNGRSTNPAHLWLTGCNGEMATRLQRIPGYDKWIIEKEAKPYLEAFENRKENLVYLTADAETVTQKILEVIVTGRKSPALLMN